MVNPNRSKAQRLHGPVSGFPCSVAVAANGDSPADFDLDSLLLLRGAEMGRAAAALLEEAFKRDDGSVRDFFRGLCRLDDVSGGSVMVGGSGRARASASAGFFWAFGGGVLQCIFCCAALSGGLVGVGGLFG